jgi:hypothetical protein
MATSQGQPAGDSPRTAAYIPFKSFLTALDRLKQGHPATIDPSFWHGMSGGLQRQMYLAFRFLGLLEENGEVTKAADALAKAEDRRALMGQLLKDVYEALFQIGLEHATPNQFNEALREYNVSGSTLEKARSFFLQAAKFAEITLSPGIQSFSKRGASGQRRRTPVPRYREEAGGADGLEEEEGDERIAQHGSSRTIPLRGGGSATLSFDVDVWDMTPEDQKFVFDMIRAMTEYQTVSESK